MRVERLRSGERKAWYIKPPGRDPDALQHQMMQHEHPWWSRVRSGGLGEMQAFPLIRAKAIDAHEDIFAIALIC